MKKIDGLDERLLASVDRDFRDVPREDQIQHRFSPGFKSKLLERAARRGADAVCGVLRRAVAAVVVVALAFGGVSNVLAGEREVMRLVLSEGGAYYGVAFDRDVAQEAPKKMEIYWLPDRMPEGYRLRLRAPSRVSLVCSWDTPQGQQIDYIQRIIPQSYQDASGGVSAEGTRVSAEAIGAYTVHVIESEEQYTAYWTDRQYLFQVRLFDFEGEPGRTVERFIESLCPAEEVEPYRN